MATNLRLSGSNPGDPREESDIRFNYNNMNQIVCASTKLGGNQPIHYSPDGGVTWLQSTLTGFPGDVRQGDPTIDWTSDGTAWSVTIGIGLTTLILRCYKSTDGGATWTFDSTVTGLQNNMDKEALWVDHSPSSPHKDNMYLIWHNGGPCFVAARPGPGGAWQPPLQISGAETTGTAIGSDIKTNANGDVFAFWPDTGSQNLFVAKSTDGGASFGAPVTIATTVGSFNIGVPAQDDRRVLIYLSGGAYRTATQNLVFATWIDLAGGPGCNFSGDEPGGSVASSCKTRIWFARSTDGGATWGAPKKLNDQVSLNDQIFQRLAVDESSGVLMVVYYDTVNDPARVQAELWMQTSYDFGVTWTAPAQVATAETNETAPSAELNFQYGDYIGLTGYSGTFFACWTDRRSGGAEEIWGAPLTARAALATAIADSGKFASVCEGSFADELLTIDNTSAGNLSISNITSSSPDFLAPGVLSYPLIVSPGGSIDVVIRFQPTSFGVKSATITIFSNDPAGPHKIHVSGVCHAPRLTLLIANAGNFGKTCAGSFVDEALILNNSGKCTLTVTDITSSNFEFLVPHVSFYPLTIGPGESLPAPIRFEPNSVGVKTATLTVTSNDPAGPHKIHVSGVCQAPRLSLAIANSGNFGKACVGSFLDEPMILNNSGRCLLLVTGVTSSSSDFLVPHVVSFPLAIGAGNSLSLPIRFEPTSFGPKSATLTVTSDDPAGPHAIGVTGDAPSGKLTITGSTIFGGVKCCHTEQRIVSICNTGDCNLHVSHVGFKHKRRHFRLINNPFPAKVRPGSCLSVVIQYKATERASKSCELVIHSDDPHDPIRCLDVIAYTIWDCCECSCKESHKDCGCCKHNECCDDDDDEDDSGHED